MKIKKSATALAFFALFFFRPAFTSAHGFSLSRTVAAPARPTGVCYPLLSANVDFRWAFAAMSIRDGKPITEPVTKDMVLKSGDRLKMMVDLQKRCFVYLFHEDRRSGIKLLFPYTLEQFTQYYQPGRSYLIPRAHGWFRLDNNPGREVFYLIASPKRLEGLEKAYLQYKSARGDANREAEKRLQRRIDKLVAKRRALCSPAERPVPIGGALRSLKGLRASRPPHIAAFAHEIVSKGLTARTYTIEHE